MRGGFRGGTPPLKREVMHGCSDRTLCTQSSIFDLTGGQVFEWPVGQTENAMTSLKNLGFVILKDAFRENELAGVEAAIMPMIEEILKQEIAFGNRGPNRMSASGFYANLGKQPGIDRLRQNETLARIMQDIFAEHGYEYGGAGADIAGPHSGYQWLHSDDNCSQPYAGNCDVRHRHWVPSMLLAVPVLEEWTNLNGPLRIIPWNSVPASLYDKIIKDGMKYDDEKALGWNNSWLPAHRGDLLIRDVRALHGGTPNNTANARSMVSLMFYNKEAVNKYPENYVPHQGGNASLPRFYHHDEQAAIEQHAWHLERYGVMKTL